MMRSVKFTVFYFALAVLLPLTSSSLAVPTPPTVPAKLNVVVTTNLIANIATTLCSDDCSVTSLMGPGVDPHLYRASPKDMRSLVGADLILVHGLHLEGKMLEALEGLKRSGKEIVEVTDQLPKENLIYHSQLDLETAGQPDPHVWFDPVIWQKVASRIANVLSKRMPHQTSTIDKRSLILREDLNSLDSWTRDQLSKIPKEHRVLVTAHDAFSYFGRAYSLEILAIQGISTDSEASLSAINKLIDTLVARKIPAIFAESSVPYKAVEALIEGCSAKGHTVKIGGELYSDSLGSVGSGADTFLSMVRHNVSTIAKSLSVQ